MKCEREKLLVWLLASLLLWCFVLPAATYGADVMGNQNLNPQPPSGTPSASQPTPSLDDFDRLLMTIEQESEKLSAELKATSDELKLRKEQLIDLELRLQAYAFSISSLERTLKTEREAAQIAISSAIEREARALKERDFWMVGGITLAAIGITALALSFVF